MSMYQAFFMFYSMLFNKLFNYILTPFLIEWSKFNCVFSVQSYPKLRWTNDEIQQQKRCFDDRLCSVHEFIKTFIRSEELISFELNKSSIGKLSMQSLWCILRLTLAERKKYEPYDQEGSSKCKWRHRFFPPFRTLQPFDSPPPNLEWLLEIAFHSGRFLMKIGIYSKNAKFELTDSYISIQESTI